MARLVDNGITRYDVFPVTADSPGFANPLAPTLAELNAGTNITLMVARATSINAEPSDTVNDPGVVETANIVVPSLANYAGTLVTFRSFTNGTLDDEDLGEAIKPGTLFFLTRRLGKSYDVAYTAPDTINFLGKFLVDNFTTTGGTGDGYVKSTYPLLQQGVLALDKKPAA